MGCGPGIHEVRVVHHAVNQGIGGGMRTGIAKARGRWLILIPADLALDLGEVAPLLRRRARCGRRRGHPVGSARLQPVPSRGFMGQHPAHPTAFRNERAAVQLHQHVSCRFLRRMDVTCWRNTFFFAEILIRPRPWVGGLVSWT